MHFIGERKKERKKEGTKERKKERKNIIGNQIGLRFLYNHFSIIFRQFYIFIISS